LLSPWIIEVGQVNLMANSLYPPKSGVHLIGLLGAGQSSLSQTVSLTIGVSYILSFSMAATPTNQKVFSLKVLIGSQIWSFSVDSTGIPISDLTTHWKSKNIEFIATTMVTKITFQSTTTGNVGPLLDLISIQEKGSSSLLFTQNPSLCISDGLRKSSLGRNFVFPISEDEKQLLKSNQNSNITSNSLILTDRLKSQSGTIFYSLPISFSKFPTFSVSFSFKISPQESADMLGFMLSLDPNINSFTGNSTFGIKFDTYQNTNDNSGNFLGIIKSGNVVTNYATTIEPLEFDNNQIWNVWADYDGNQIYVRYSQDETRPDQAKLTFRTNLNQFGNQDVYFGFFGLRGSVGVQHEIVRQIKITGSLDPWDISCQPGQYYDMSNGGCRECPLGTFNSGSSSCCHQCPLGYRSSSDRSSCIDVNECSSNPCKNGGSCLNGINRFTCLCTSQYRGIYCESLNGNVCPSLTNAQIQEFNFPLDFTQLNQFTSNGNAIANSTSFILTGPYAGVSGSVYFKSPSVFSSTPAFSVHFRFKITGTNGEGLVFSLIGNSPSVVGGSGGNLGFIGKPSIGIKFDTFQSVNEVAKNYVGYLKDGNPIENLAYVIEGTPFDNSQIWNVWIDYDGAALHTRYSNSSSRPLTPRLSANIDLSNLINTNIYFGFSASTGTLGSKHEIVESFSFANTLQSFGTNCSVGNFYNFGTGTCSLCPLGFINTGSLSCCSKCENGLTSTLDRTECVIDRCASNPCQNGGTCLNQLDNFVCECIFGVTGTFCETLSGQLCLEDSNSSQIMNYLFPLESTSDFLSNGNSILQSSSLILVQSSAIDVGSIFSKTKLLLSTPSPIFSVNFGFKMSTTGVEGFAFIITTSTTIGSAGSSLGYTGSPSIAIKLDTRNNGANDPSDSYVGILQDGNSNNLIASTNQESPTFNNNQLWYVWIDYDGSYLHVRYSMTPVRPQLPNLSTLLLLENLSGKNISFGFSGSTFASGSTSKIEILNSFSFTNDFQSFGQSCESGNFYNFATGKCVQCPKNTFKNEESQSSCCSSCPDSLVNTFDNSNCTSIFFSFPFFSFFLFMILVLCCNFL